MKSKKRLLKESRLYVVIDKETLGSRPLIPTARKILGGGADIIQYRDKLSDKYTIFKECLALSKLVSGKEIIFIVNDHVDIAKIVNSDGVHLGQDDLAVQTARGILGKDKIIGLSCHSLKQAQKAASRNADYVSIGPVFATPTKPQYRPVGLELIKKVNDKIRIPFFAIGSINENNIGDALAMGAKRVAVCRAVCKAKNPALAAKRLSAILQKI